MKILRKIIIILLILSLIPISFGSYLIWNNNRTVAPPSKQEISASLEKSIQWLVNNRSSILNENNSMLWWMVKESAELTNDQRLDELFEAYKKKWLDPDPNSPWLHLFDSDCRVSVEDWGVRGLPDYNVFFLYGLTCSKELEEMDIIDRQKDEDFCWKEHPISPACVTHQLMGIRFMERRNCGDPEYVQDMIKTLQDKIVMQLTWDPRVVDVYIQRLLMLTDSGAEKRVEAVWLRNVLDAQLLDGGWGPNQSIFALGSSRYLCFTGRMLAVRELKSSFHATAQGVLLLSLLDSKKV